MDLHFKQNDWDHLHDCIYHVTGKKSTQKELEKIFTLIPKELQLDAYEWGVLNNFTKNNIK